MLNPEERNFIQKHAYVPEHLPDYVQSISGAEPFLHEGHICYVQERHLIWVGYPLLNQETNLQRSYESACARFRVKSVAFIGPSIPAEIGRIENFSEDMYYKLELPIAPLKQDVAYMIRRARQELRICEGGFGGEHQALINAFLSNHESSPGHREIFKKIPTYLEHSETTRLLEARRDDDLAAFNIVDLGSAYYMFYMFNFRSPKLNVPGASDLLFDEMIRLAQAQGKGAMNLGLGITPGVRSFKEKWGALPFLDYKSALVRRKADGLLDRILGLWQNV
jgi:hypothetical protein